MAKSVYVKNADAPLNEVVKINPCVVGARRN
jgi:hypothetical protein